MFGAVALILLTGCLNGVVGDNGDNGLEAEGEATVGVAVGMDAETQQSITEDLNQSEQELLQQAQMAQFGEVELSEEELERAEALQQELEQAQQEAMDDIIADFEGEIDASQTLQVEDSIEAGGESLYLVSGNAGELIGLLDVRGAEAIVSENQYQQIVEQQQAQQQMPAPEGGQPAPQP